MLTFADRHLLWAINRARSTHGLAVLRGSSVLDAEAARRAAGMARSRVFVHEIPGVGYAWDELPASFSWVAAGECIATYWPSAEAAVAAWLASPTHRAVVLGRWQLAGAAVRGVCDVALFAR